VTSNCALESRDIERVDAGLRFRHRATNTKEAPIANNRTAAAAVSLLGAPVKASRSGPEFAVTGKPTSCVTSCPATIRVFADQLTLIAKSFGRPETSVRG
jgi:hypothetical protein